MKRQRHLVDDSAYPVFLTTTIVRWIPVFSDNVIAEESLHVFEKLREELDVEVIAYVLMPSHLHAVVKTARKGDISIMMRKWKSLTARLILERCHIAHTDWIARFEENAKKYNKIRPQNHQVWMLRFDDFAIRNEKQLAIKVNYIHGNPVKAGLVDNYTDCPYSSAKDYYGGKNGFVTIGITTTAFKGQADEL